MTENKVENKIEIPNVGGYSLAQVFSHSNFYAEFLYSDKKMDFVKGDLIYLYNGRYTIRYKVRFGTYYVIGISDCFVPMCKIDSYKLYMNTIEISHKSQEKLLKDEFDVEDKIKNNVSVYIPKKMINNIGILLFNDNEKKIGVKNLGLYQLIEYARLHYRFGNKLNKDGFYRLKEIPSIKKLEERHRVISFCVDSKCIERDLKNLERLLEESQ